MIAARHRAIVSNAMINDDNRPETPLLLQPCRRRWFILRYNSRSGYIRLAGPRPGCTGARCWWLSSQMAFNMISKRSLAGLVGASPWRLEASLSTLHMWSHDVTALT